LRYHIICLFSFLLSFQLVVGQTLPEKPANDSALHLNNDTTQVEIGKITITGNKKTKDYIILRELSFKTGDITTIAELQMKLLRAKQQVFNTTLFLRVEIYPTSQKGDVMDLQVDVKERWYILPLPTFVIADRNFSTWIKDSKASFDRVNYGLSVFHNNLSGRNDALAVGFVNGYSRQYSVGYSQPFIDKSLKHGLSYGVAYTSFRELNYRTDNNKQTFYKNVDEFVSSNFSFNATYSYRPDVNWRHYFSASYSFLNVSDSILKRNPNYFGSTSNSIQFPEFRYVAQYFDVDYIYYPLKGFLGTARFTKRGLTKEMNTWDFEISALLAQKIAPKTYIQLQGIGNLKLPFEQPFINQRYMGYGGLFLRGLETYVVDGVGGVIGKATVVRELFDFKIRFPWKNKFIDEIPFKIFFKIYGDLGFAYNPQNSIGNIRLSNKLLSTAGLGIDVLSFYDIVFKFEYSFNQLDENGLFLQWSTSLFR
jgi:outer membrane protein assembly factor BamA